MDPHRGAGGDGDVLIPLFCLALLGEVSVTFTGAPPLPPPGETVAPSDSALAGMAGEILLWYLYQGYPFGSAGMYFTAEDSLTVNLVPGRRATLEGVRFPADLRTRPGLLLRRLAMREGDPYDPEAVSRWVDALNRMDIVQDAGPPELYLGPMGNLVVYMPVVEAPLGWFAGGMSYNEVSGVLGGGELVLCNVFGGGRRLELAADATEWGVDGSFLYREPWILGSPAGFSLYLNQEIPDSGSVNRRWETRVFYELGSLEVSGGGGSWSGWPAGGVRQRYDYAAAGLDWDLTRNSPQGARGFQGSVSTTAGNASGADSDSTWFMATCEGSASLADYRGALGFGLGVMAGGVIRGEWLSSALWRLGGYGTLRGYSDDAYRAGEWGIASPEISLGETATRLYVFSDLGIIRTETGIERPASAGGGIRGTAGRLRYDAGAGFPLDRGPGDARFYLSALVEI